MARTVSQAAKAAQAKAAKSKPQRSNSTKIVAFLTEAQKIRRLDWANRHKRWSRAKWAKVLWSDETHIELWQGAQASIKSVPHLQSLGIIQVLSPEL